MILLPCILLFHKLLIFPSKLNIMNKGMRSVSIVMCMDQGNQVMWGQTNPKDLPVMKPWPLNHCLLMGRGRTSGAHTGWYWDPVLVRWSSILFLIFYLWAIILSISPQMFGDLNLEWQPSLFSGFDSLFFLKNCAQNSSPRAISESPDSFAGSRPTSNLFLVSVFYLFYSVSIFQYLLSIIFQ